MYPKDFKDAVLAKYPDARVTSIGPLGVSFSIPNGVSPSGNKRERVIARYSCQTKTWKIL